MRLFGYMAMDVEHMIHVLLQDTLQHNIVELPCPLFAYGKQWGRMVFYLMLCMPIPYAPMVASCHLTAVSTGFLSEIGTKLRDWAVGQAWGSCYSWAALSSNDSKTL